MTRQFNYSFLNGQINDVFRPYFESKNSQTLLYGGRGSSKSHHVIEKHLLRIIRAIEQCRKKEVFGFFRKTQPALRRSVIELTERYVDKWGIRGICEFNKSEMVHEFEGGHKILHMGLDDSQKTKSVEGLTSAFIEEANECTEQDTIDVQMLLRGQTDSYHQLTLAFNPPPKSHWIYKKYFERGIAKINGNQFGMSESVLDCFVHHSTYKDNRFLPDGYGDMLEQLNGRNANLYRTYALGEWGLVEGLVFTDWEIDDLQTQAQYFDNMRYGLDFGFTVHPSAFIACHYCREKQTIYVWKEMYIRGATNAVLAEAVAPYVHGAAVWCDSAEPKSITEMQQKNIAARAVRKGKDSILFGLQWLQQHRIIVDKRCVNFINEISALAWQRDRDGNLVHVPVGEDHLIDALRYAMENDMASSGGSLVL